MHWDTLGEIPQPVRPGWDMPGSVRRMPGGVALHVARSICALGEEALLWCTVGDDNDGRRLIASLEEDGLSAGGVVAMEGERTDRCMFILDREGSVTGVSDCRLLESASGQLVHRLADSGVLRSGRNIVLIVDGNLPEEILNELSGNGPFEGVPIRFAVASDGKAERAQAFLGRKQTVIHLNRAEAEVAARCKFPDSTEAARFLVEAGFERVIVSDVHTGISDCDQAALVSIRPKRAAKRVRVLGAGDRLLAAHLVAEFRGFPRHDALEYAAEAANDYVAGK